MKDPFHNTIEEYNSIEGEVQLEYYGRQIHIKGGLPILLLGGIVEKPEDAYVIMINNASKDEVEKIAEFIDDMRNRNVI